MRVEGAQLDLDLVRVGHVDVADATLAGAALDRRATRVARAVLVSLANLQYECQDQQIVFAESLYCA